ncbi:hypothetical protein P879_03889 [Paragonimus westermani]|uniref:Uncharacterized protein n=1 Tax=Paragonimus westermani TaxID=34504 RepID=A0A8T0DH78_9TREM|nr:hypothetical protein P879_03889 [Paragonimus westermani]
MHCEQTWIGTAGCLTIFWILLLVPKVCVFTSTEYRTRVPAVEMCNHFLTDGITRASLLKAMNADEVPTFQISEPISTGMVEVRNLTIQGLHMARMTRPIHISEQMSGSLPVLRLELWVALEQLNIEGEARLRLKTSKPKSMTILVKPSNLYIALDLRTSVKTQDDVVPINKPSFTVHSVSFTDWNGIRINGKGFMLKLFRLMGGSNAFAGTIRRCVEKTIHKQITKALDKFPPNMLFTSLFTQGHTGSNE